MGGLEGPTQSLVEDKEILPEMEFKMTENRESFFSRIEPHFSRKALLKVQLAYTLSKYWHRSQTRKEQDVNGDPLRYFEHVRRVALVLMDEGKCYRPEMVIAALLHDSIEDTRDVDLTPDMIEENFGEDVVCIVKTLSKVPKDGYLERFQVCTDWRPYMIKACDRLDNLRSLVVAGTTEEFIRRQVTETKDKYYPLFDRMMTLVPPEHHERAVFLRDEIRHSCNKAAFSLNK